MLKVKRWVKEDQFAFSITWISDIEAPFGSPLHELKKGNRPVREEVLTGLYVSAFTAEEAIQRHLRNAQGQLRADRQLAEELAKWPKETVNC